MSPAPSTRELAPPQHEGAQSNTTHKVKTDNQKEARALYQSAKTRLLDVNHWKDISGKQSAVFTLNDQHGRFVKRLAREGDLIRIAIPGPDAQDGQEYDWVQVERIFEASGHRNASSYTGMQVRPVKAPDKAPGAVSHFFQSEATSSFVVEKRGRIVKASVYGRNEQPNVSPDSFRARTRNLVVWLGALLGFSKLQWKSLVKGMLKED